MMAPGPGEALQTPKGWIVTACIRARRIQPHKQQHAPMLIVSGC